MIKFKLKIGVLFFMIGAWFFGFSQPGHTQLSMELTSPLTLNTAVMCESLEAYKPKNSGVVFSITNGKVICYTSFDFVPEKTVIYHNWYKKDQPVTSRRLILKPPSWSAFTQIQLREADKGPWRVEVVDENKNLIQTLRFSITE